MPNWDIRKPIPAGASIVVCCALALIAKYLGEVGLLEIDPLEDRVGDRRIVWSAKHAERQRSDIALVTVTESTLRDYLYVSPIPRGILAALVAEIDEAGPTAIGLDFIVERRSSEDQDLTKAIANAKHPVVLGTLDDRYGDSNVGNARILGEELAAQESFLKEAGAIGGHLWLEHKTGLFNKDDETVRYVAAPNLGHPPRESFSYELAKAAGYSHRPASRTIAWLLPPEDGSVGLFARVAVQRHQPSALASGARLLSPAETELLKGRIVLVGADMMDRDWHRTPLFIRNGRKTPGVEIHAQLVAQFVDGNRDVRETPKWLELALYFGIGFIFLAASTVYKMHTHREVAATAIALVAFVVLLLFRIDLPVGPIIFVSAAGALVVPLAGWCVELFERIRELFRWWHVQGTRE